MWYTTITFETIQTQVCNLQRNVVFYELKKEKEYQFKRPTLSYIIKMQAILQYMFQIYVIPEKCNDIIKTYFTEQIYSTK